MVAFCVPTSTLVCSFSVLSFATSRAWFSSERGTPLSVLYRWLCYKFLRQSIETYFIRLLLYTSLLNYLLAFWEYQCVLLTVGKCSQSREKKKNKTVEQCKHFPDWNLRLKVFCSLKQKNYVYPGLLKKHTAEVAELLTAV